MPMGKGCQLQHDIRWFRLRFQESQLPGCHMIIGEGIPKDVARVAIWFLLRYLVPAFPAPFELKVNRRLGSWFYRLSRKKAALVRRNMTAVLGQAVPVDTYAKMAFENHFVDQYLIFSFPKIGVHNIDRYLAVDGSRHLDEALNRGKGAIVIHGHVGPRLLPLFSLALKGYGMNQIEGPLAQSLSMLGRYCAKQKQLLEKRIPANIFNGQRFLRPVFQALNRNEIVMIAGDGMGGGRFIGNQVGVEFLGYRLKFPTGPVSLAGKTGASLVPLFTMEGVGEVPYRSVIYPSWVVPAERLHKEALSHEVKKFVKLLESVVRQYPHLWHFWDEFFDRVVNLDATPKGSIYRHADSLRM
jgi:phosphatidylinositol dimannoside acyltransferase